jgi:hypothetical protein
LANTSPNTDIIFTKLIDILGQIQAPVLHNSAWLGPFEQLVGAAFSLIESEKMGFSTGKYNPLYHPQVQCKIVSLLGEFEAGKQMAERGTLNHWLSRYYFNSGIQRVTFAAERLIATFAALPCKCGGAPEIVISNDRAPKFQERFDGAQARLAHVETEYPLRLTNMKAVLGQLAIPYHRNHAFDASKGLAMMRRDVNNRKHSVYKRVEVLESLPRPVSGTYTWSEAGCNTQMKVAVDCLKLVVGAYSELLAWYPLAKF